MMNRIYGVHLLLDGYVKNGNNLNPENICSMFDSLVETLDMKYLMRPIITRVKYDENKLKTNDDEGGWSGICQITTSHISIHTWPLRSAFMMDVFSCKDFDTLMAIKVVDKILSLENYYFRVITRDDPYGSS